MPLTSRFILPFVMLFTLTFSFAQENLNAMDNASSSESLKTPNHSSDDNFEITPALLIETGENKSRRWITISGGISDSSRGVTRPILEMDGNDGSFSWVISGMDTATYLGSRLHRAPGHFPVQYQVDFIDSESIVIRGKTLPFDDIKNYYSFTNNIYRLEFVFSENLRTIPPVGSEGQKTNPTPIQSDRPDSKMSLSDAMDSSRSDALMSMLYNAIIIAGGGLVIVLLLLVIILLFRKLRRQKGETASQHFSKVLDDKTQGDVAQVEQNPAELDIMTPELREEKIRMLMESDGISYDEAALRVQYETMNKDYD